MQIEYKTVDDLTAYENNTRTHSDDQIAQIAASIKEFGFTNPVLIDGNNRIIAGHGRVKAAPGAGLSEVPCIVIDHLSDDQVRALVIADNQLGLNSGWNESLLASELAALSSIDMDMDLLGFSSDQLAIALAKETGEVSDDIKALESLAESPPMSDAEFEREMRDKSNKGIAEIVPQYAEHYQAFIIVCSNVIDESWLRQKLNLQNKKQSYKDSTIRPANIIAVEVLRELIK